MWVHPDCLSGVFYRRLKTAGLRPIRLRDLRHSHASLLLQAGVHPEIVSERLGHHSVAFTPTAEDLADRVFGPSENAAHEEVEQPFLTTE